MDNGLSSLVAGKRRRDGYANDEDVKENLKASRQWYNGSQQKEPQNSNGHYKQQHLSDVTTSTPSLNMEQRVMAAAALQDLRGITESSKAFFQSQLKYQQVMNSDAVTLGDSSSTALPPLPYIRTPPLHSEADAHNGSPSSSSSGPYNNSMPVGQYNGVMHRSNEAPIQQQHESESSYSSLMHTSQSTLLAQNTQQPDRENGLHSSGALASYGQRDDFPHGQVVQSVVQNGNVHQHPARTLVQNGVAFHHTLPGNGFQNGTQNGGLQQQQVLPNQLPQGDSQRLGSNALHAQGRHGMASSSHHQQQQMGLPMHQQGGIHRMQQENMVQYQTGQMSQSNNLAPQQQPGQHCNSFNGAPPAAPAAPPAAHPSVQGCSSGFQHPEPAFSPLHGDFHQVPNSWYPSMRDSTTETQPSVSTSRLLLPPSVTDQRGLSLPSLPPQQQQQQLSQVPGGFGEVQIPDQDHSSSSTVVANGALDDPALPRALMRPPTRLTRRSYTKVYKLGSITRAVDVNRFKNYTELRCGLAHMFNLEGQLDQKLGWQLIFTDNEDDLLLVGDDPWEEFVRNVRAIRILTPAEVFYYTNEDKWTAATYNSNGGSAPKLL